MNINKMSKEEKLEHRKFKKELKEKINEEDKKRLEMISKPAIQYKFLKIKSLIGNKSALSINAPFTADDIMLAKKCMLNKLSRPPNYDQYDIKVDDGKSVTSLAVTATEVGKLLPLDDFSKIPDVKEHIKRLTGTWILDKDFLGCFQYVQIFHDPNRFKNKLVTTCSSVFFVRI